MENQRHYFIVGLFITTTLVAGLFFAIRFLSSQGIKYNEYAILFNKNIGNLSIGSTVTLQGITAGQVTKVSLLDDDTTVRAEIIVDNNFKIREDTVARLEESAISGVVKINLENQGFSDEELVALPFQEMPIIPSDNSVIEQALDSIPDILNATNDIFNKLSTLLSDNNTQNIQEILSKTNDSLDGLLTVSHELPNIVEKVKNLTDNLNSLSVRLSKASEDVPDMMENLSATLDDISKLTHALEAEIKTARKDFSSATQSLETTLHKTRQTLDTAADLGNKISNRPTSLIMQPQYKGYRATE